MAFRSHLIASLLGLTLLGGCQVGTITAPGFMPEDGGVVLEDASTEDLFAATVRPLLSDRCGNCHTNEATAPLFLEGDYYDSVMAYPGLVVAGNPGISELLTKGAHDGPAWNAAETATITTWIEAEGMTGPIEPPPPGALESVEITIDEGGVNQIPLDSLGLPGSSIEFDATSIASGMRLTDVVLVGGTGGAAVSSPRFIMHTSDGMDIPDADQFSGSDLRAIPGQRTELTTAMVLAAYPDGGTLSIIFASAMQME